VNKSLIIYNPKAGTGKKRINHTDPTIPIVETTGPGNATEIVKENFDDYDMFIAAGGDGTVNEVGRALINTNKILGIIPLGSGNGLALELHLSHSTFSFTSSKFRTIDSILINGRSCLNVAGTGFEAEVSAKFSRKRSRGFITYIRTTIETFLKYKPQAITFKWNEEISDDKIFSLSIANSRQYGNNAFISPLSKLDDGYFEVCIVKPFPLVYSPIFSFRLFTKTIHKSRFYKVVKSKKITILNEAVMQWHIDGDPVSLTGPFDVTIEEGSLKILA